MNRKNITMLFVSFVLLVIAIIVWFGILQEQSSGDHVIENHAKPMVSVTMFPLYDIVRTIAGEDVETQLLLSPGVSPHTYELDPKTALAVNKSDIVFSAHKDIDGWLDAQAISPDITQVILADTVTLQPFGDIDDHDEDAESAHTAEDTHGHGSEDPHFWLGPDTVVEFVPIIVSALSQLDSASAENFENRADNFLAELALKEVEWKQRIDVVSQKDIIVFHDAYGYLADFLGIHIVGTFEPFPGKEPTAKDLEALLEIIDEHKIEALFVEPQFAQSYIETFAADYGLKIGVLDPLGGIHGIDSYIDLIESNVVTFENIL